MSEILSASSGNNQDILEHAMKATPQTAGTDCDVTTDPKTAVSFVFSQLVCQVCVYWALARVLNIECQLPVCFVAVTLTRFSVFRNSVFLTLKFCFLTFIFFSGCNIWTETTFRNEAVSGDLWRIQQTKIWGLASWKPWEKGTDKG